MDPLSEHFYLLLLIEDQFLSVVFSVNDITVGFLLGHTWRLPLLVYKLRTSQTARELSRGFAIRVFRHIGTLTLFKLS